MKQKNNIIYVLIGVLLYIALPVERKYFINIQDEKENKKEITLELAKEMANVKVQIENRTSGPTEFPFYEITVEKVLPIRNILISIVTIILISLLDPIRYIKQSNFKGNNFKNKKGNSDKDDDLEPPLTAKISGTKVINHANENQKQIDLFKALYNIAKEYVKEYLRNSEREGSYIDYSIMELSKLTGMDEYALKNDGSFRKAAILALEDATLPEGQQLVFDAIYASIEAKGNNAQKVHEETIKLLEDSISKAETKTIKIGSLEMTLDEAKELLTFLDKRYNPFVTSIVWVRSQQQSLS